MYIYKKKNTWVGDLVGLWGTGGFWLGDITILW